MDQRYGSISSEEEDKIRMDQLYHWLMYEFSPSSHHFVILAKLDLVHALMMHFCLFDVYCMHGYHEHATVEVSSLFWIYS